MEIDEKVHAEIYSSRYFKSWDEFGLSATLRLNKLDSLIPSGKKVLELSVMHKMPWWDRNAMVLADCVKQPLQYHKQYPGKVFDFNGRFPFQDNSFDAIAAVEVFEHLYNNEFFVKECRRVLRPGGMLIGSVPNEYHLFKRIQILLGKDVFGCGEHLRHFNKTSLNNVLGKSFNDVKILGYGPGVIWPSLLSSNLIFVCRKL